MKIVIATIILLYNFIYLASARGINIGVCGDQHFDCDCGGPGGYKYNVPVKQCTYFYRWKPYCKPCDDVKKENFCSKFSQCLECSEEKCNKCPPNRYGQWCSGVCTCQNNGACNPVDGTCSCRPGFLGRNCEIAEIPSCPKPEALLNGKVAGTNYEVGKTVIYSCNDGYVLAGANTRTCTGDSVWSGHLPICEKTCPTLKFPENLISEINPFRDIGVWGSSAETFVKYIRFKCHAGFQLIGDDLLTCLANGEWDRGVPTCSKTCDAPPTLLNGIIINPHRTVVEGSKVQYMCNKDHILLGAKENICSKDGKWRNLHPKCEKVSYCTDPGTTPFSERKITSGEGGDFSQGTRITYVCSPNAILIGKEILECLKNGTWTGATPSCIYVSNVTVNCMTKGEEVLGAVNTPVRITCPADCNKHNPPVWGTVIYRKDSHVCAAAIHAGMIPKEGGSVFVINNGVYNLFVQSNSNGVKTNRHRSQAQSFRFEFVDDDPDSSCPRGWTQAGKYCVAYINKQASWNEAASICHNLASEMFVGNYSVNEESKVLLSRVVPRTGLSHLWFTDKITAVVNYKKQLINDFLNLNDNDTLPEEPEQKSLLSNLTEESYSNNSTSLKELEELNVTKDEEETSCGALDGGKSVVKSDCEEKLNFVCRMDAKLQNNVIACDEPQAIPFGSMEPDQKLGDLYVEGSTVEYTCDPLYLMNGESKLTCTNNGTWSSSAPKCSRAKACRNPSGIKNGQYDVLPALQSRTGVRGAGILKPTENVKLPAGYHHVGTRVQFSCESRYYNLIGSSTRTCMSDDQWSGRQPTCQPVCGISSAPRAPFIVHGQPTKLGQWPWQVGIARFIEIEEATKDLPAGKMWYLMCGAALVTDSWVVTAAHCVTHPGSNNALDPSEIRMYFGKYYRNDSLDDDWIQIRHGQDIQIHPDFNPVLYDADIALVHLNESVKLTSRVQPVCLSDVYSGMSERHLQAGTIGVVTGWGVNEKGENSPNLLQADIPVVSSAECEEGYKEAGVSISVSGNMFCAGFESGEARDACTGDSGGPFVMSEGTGVHERWYLEGLVSWGSPLGCGASRQYGGYTKLSVFLEWIQQYI